MHASIAFHGAAQTVTGSKHLITINGKKILVDCGLFQGNRELRERNWREFPFSPHELDAVILTHAHTDHIGLLPKLVKEGYHGPIYATGATIGLCRISLPDSARLQEEEARHRNKHGYTRHAPALPLYTEEDAYKTLKQMKRVKYGELMALPGQAEFQFYPAGHIAGAAFAEIRFQNHETLLMGGDLGRYDVNIIKDPTRIEEADYLVIESTYGDRIHSNEDPKAKLREVLTEAYQSSGVVLVPSFAIGRTQELLYLVHELQDENAIPRIPVFIDSPMAVSATQLYRTAYEDHDEDMQTELSIGHEPLDPDNVEFVRDREQSKALNSRPGPFVVIAGSGMANGGRILHHFIRHLGNPNTTVLFTGYQGEGTLGRELIEGNPVVEIFGKEVSVAARVDKLNSLSAHADQSEMMRWLSGFNRKPKKTFIVHGEPEAQLVLQEKIRQDLGWEPEIPTQDQQFTLF